MLLLLGAAGLTGYNLWDEQRVQETTTAVVEVIRPESTVEAVSSQPSEPMKEAEIPDYLLNPEMDMPVQEIDGHSYIGVLKIETLGLELPVISEWSNDELKIAPCRYTGSAYLDNLVLVAHNYQAHFASIRELSPGDEVVFTDMDGNVFTYEVILIETLTPTDVEEMTSGEFDLTLFTCTPDNSARVTVRCDRK